MTATAATVSAREAYQVLKDMALETRVISACAAADDTVSVETDGWRMVLLTKVRCWWGASTAAHPMDGMAHWTAGNAMAPTQWH